MGLRAPPTPPRSGLAGLSEGELLAGKGGDKEETICELAALTYHLMVLMAQMDITPEQVLSQLTLRHVVDKKVK